LVKVVNDPPLSLRTPSEPEEIDPELVTSKVVVALFVQGPVVTEPIKVALPQPLACESTCIPKPNTINSALKTLTRRPKTTKLSNRAPRAGSTTGSSKLLMAFDIFRYKFDL
jgi:hypothetical protein